MTFVAAIDMTILEVTRPFKVCFLRPQVFGTKIYKNKVPTLDGAVIVSQRHLLSTIWRLGSG